MHYIRAARSNEKYSFLSVKFVLGVYGATYEYTPTLVFVFTRYSCIGIFFQTEKRMEIRKRKIRKRIEI